MPTPSFSGSPEELSYDRGTVERINKSLLSAHVRHSLKGGELTASDFAKWLDEPWTVIRFLEGRVSPKDESERSDPGALRKIERGDTEGLMEDAKDLLKPLDDLFRRRLGLKVAPGRDILIVLREWAEADDISAEERVVWENAHVEEKEAATQAVATLHGALAPSVEMYEKTEKNLRATKGLNAVENILRGTKEYVWDEFRDHPEMSVGLVLVTIMAYKLVKGTKLWTITKYAAAATVAGAFLKQKFGIQPTEKIAEIAERLGLDGAAEAVRGFRDTLHRGLFGAEEEGTINGYFHEKLGFHRTNERIAFQAFIQQNPKKFIQWYDAAKRWQLDRGTRTTSVPSDVSGLVREMSKGSGIPPHFQQLPMADRTELLLGVADSVFRHIALTNGKPENAAEGLAVTMQKYVDGSYFRLLWNRFEALAADIENKYTEPAIKEQIARIRATADEFYKGMERRVQNGSDVIQFMDVLVMETDVEVLQKYQGPGMTMDELGTVLEDVKGKLVNLGGDLKKKGEDAWKDIEKFSVETVPDYWRDAWKVLRPWWESGKKEAIEGYNWLFSPQKDVKTGDALPSRFDEALADAIAAGDRTVDIALDSAPAQLLGQIGLNAKDALVLTLEEAKELAEWLKIYRDMSGSLKTAEVASVSGTRDVLIKIKEPLPDYRYIQTVTFIAVPKTGLQGVPPLPNTFSLPKEKRIPLTTSVPISVPMAPAPVLVTIPTPPTPIVFSPVTSPSFMDPTKYDIQARVEILIRNALGTREYKQEFVIDLSQ